MGHSTLCGATQSKFWGQTRCLFVGHSSEVHILVAKKGGFCSRHKHENKWNRFYVVDGEMEVVIFREAGEDVTVLTPGQFSDVPPGVDHMFRCPNEDCQCLEIYWTDGLDPGDIIRKDTGGIKE